MLVKIHFTSYLCINSRLWFYSFKKDDLTLNVKGWSGGNLSLQGPLGKVKGSNCFGGAYLFHCELMHVYLFFCM